MRRRSGSIVVLPLLLLACSSGGEEDPVATSTTVGVTTTRGSTTTASPPPTATLTDEVAVGGAYRQGVARAGEGWLFSTNQALYLTDEDFNRLAEDTAAIPSDLMAQGYDHIGDADIADGELYAPLEQPDKEREQQVMLVFDAETLEHLESITVAQKHNAWVSVADGIVYSNTEFDGDDTVLRYDLETWEPLAPLRMSRSLDRVQGGDVLGGFLWLSTDDEVDGLYRVDLVTGQVDQVGALAHADGEGEGIDATDLPSGELHALSIDVALAPIWFQHFRLDGVRSGGHR